MVSAVEVPGKVPVSITSNAVTLTERQIKDAWVLGLINDQSYIWLALKVDNPTMDKDFDIALFIQEWSAEKPEGQGEKVLKEASVMSALAKLAAKDGIEMTTQLKLGVF